MLARCKLCGHDVAALRRSHIIPKSLYGSALDDPKCPMRIHRGSSDLWPPRSRIGVYDQNLLCDDCEASLSKYDDYACRIFLRTKPTETIRVEGEELVARYDDVDVDRLRVFFLCLLWRMHATDHAMFKSVNLGTYESCFKAGTLEKNPRAVPAMDVVITKFDKSDTAIIGPTRLRLQGVNGYRVSFAGFSCWVKVDARSNPSCFDEIALSNGNPMHILLRDFRKSSELTTMKKILRIRPYK